MKEKSLNIGKSILTFCSAVTLAACGSGNQDAPTARTVLAAKAIVLDASRVTAEADIDPDELLHLVFPVRLNDPDGLDKYIVEMNDPNSTNFHRTLTPDQVRERFGPTPNQIAKLTAYLRATGFSNIKVAKNIMLVEADVPAKVAQSIFKTTIKSYALADGRKAHANKTAALVPAGIADVVKGVLGLDTVTQFRTHHVQAQGPQTRSAFANTGVSTAAITGHNPTAFPQIYNVGSTSTASNMTVAIITWGNIDQTITDLNTYTQQNGLPAVATSINYLGTKGSDDPNSTPEWNLDSQTIVGMSGGVKKLKFYSAAAADLSSLYIAANAAIQDSELPQVISMSFGACDLDPGMLDSPYKLAAAQGQTFVASTGDDGSSCKGSSGTLTPNTTEYPASSNYVVAVGGTTLNTTGNTYTSETAWSGSGGGVSKYVGAPWWQAVVPSLAGASYRSVADVAFVGDPASGAQIVVYGGASQYGGTSLSAPLFAATWARLMQSCGNNLGFALPTLYNFAKANPTMYHDVLSGSNGSYSATTGWDAVTGWGSLNIDNMRSVICPGAGYTQMTQAIYMAYLGRPADPGGLAYWSTQLKNVGASTRLAALQSDYSSNPGVKNVIDAIANSPESQSFYSTNTTTFVTQMYSVMLNRAPSSSELSNWTGQINSGALSRQQAPLAIMVSATMYGNTDTEVIGNKLAVATNFTATLTSTQAPYYSGTTANNSVHHLMQNVGYSTTDAMDIYNYNVQPVYVSHYQPSVNAAIAAIVAGTPY